MAGSSERLRSSQARRFGITTACHRRRSAGRSSRRFCAHSAWNGCGGAGARSHRRTRAARIPRNRHQSQPGPNPWLVRLPLALGNDIPGSAGAFGGGNTAPLVRPCYCADDTGAARAFLADNDLGRRTDCDVQPSSPSPYRRVVPKDRAHLQRRHRHSTPPSLVPVGFIDVPGRHRTHRNTGGPSQTSRRDSLLCGLKCRKSSLGISPHLQRVEQGLPSGRFHAVHDQRHYPASRKFLRGYPGLLTNVLGPGATVQVLQQPASVDSVGAV